ELVARIEPGEAVLGPEVKGVVVVEAASQALVVVIRVVVAQRVEGLELDAPTMVVAADGETVVSRPGVRLANGTVAERRNRPRPQWYGGNNWVRRGPHISCRGTHGIGEEAKARAQTQIRAERHHRPIRGRDRCALEDDRRGQIEVAVPLEVHRVEVVEFSAHGEALGDFPLEPDTPLPR